MSRAFAVGKPKYRWISGIRSRVFKARDCTESAMSGQVCVGQYVLLSGEEENGTAAQRRSVQNKYLLIRFRNDTSGRVHEITCVVEQLDANGCILTSSDFTFPYLAVAPGSTYTPQEAPLLQPACVDVNVRVTSYTSGAYRYALRDSGVTVSFVGQPRPARTAAKAVGEQSVVGKLPAKNTPFFWVALAAITVLLALSVYWVLYDYAAEPVQNFLKDTVPSAIGQFFGKTLPGWFRFVFVEELPRILNDFFGRIIPEGFRYIFRHTLYPLFHKTTEAAWIVTR